MAENWLFLTIYLGIWIFTTTLMIYIIFKRHRKNRHRKEMRVKLRLVKGECVEKIHSGHKCNND